MDDDKIIELYFKRDETAICQTQIKYGKYCYTIAKNILGDRLDAEECVNDTYLEIWETIPPNRPEIFSAYLAMIARRRALDRYRYNNAQKRKGSKATVSLEELVGCISNVTRLDDELEDDELANVISDFLYTLPEKECNVFLRRYWYFDSIEDICRRYCYGRSKVKMMLKRTRDKLAKYLEKENLII